MATTEFLYRRPWSPGAMATTECGAAGDELFISRGAAEFMLSAGVPLIVLLVCIKQTCTTPKHYLAR